MFKLIIEIICKVICILLFKMNLGFVFGYCLFIKLNLFLLIVFKINKIKRVVKEMRIIINYFLI